ncbi:hypothetical protein chiPu_0001703 [Chiloscyllium punctatum]|uniref:Uncharacterized protein n=1 Tax=Chiloscyllium punctatum TaxID=137246 RepID=A0A401RYW8_CHIPU|nr:hypothetical protein [Chiloscyllium punctatum]
MHQVPVSLSCLPRRLRDVETTFQKAETRQNVLMQLWLSNPLVTLTTNLFDVPQEVSSVHNTSLTNLHFPLCSIAVSTEQLKGKSACSTRHEAADVF